MSISPAMLRFADLFGEILVAANKATEEEVVDLKCIFGAAVGDANWKRAERALISIEVRQIERDLEPAIALKLKEIAIQGMDDERAAAVLARIEQLNALAKKVENVMPSFLDQYIPCVNVQSVAADLANGRFMEMAPGEPCRPYPGASFKLDPPRPFLSHPMHQMQIRNYLSERGFELLQELQEKLKAATSE